jgi:hypothetical protein
MSRPWPLLIVTKSGVVHISDPEDADGGTLDYACRCGRKLSFRGSNMDCIHSQSVTGDEEPSDEFSSGEYKQRRAWFYKGGLKLCSKCGTPEDFDAAVDKYREETHRRDQERKEESSRRAVVLKKLRERASEILDGLVTGQLEEFPCAHEDGELRFWVGEMQFSVKCENLYELAEQLVEEEESPSTECGRTSTECGGGS